MVFYLLSGLDSHNRRLRPKGVGVRKGEDRIQRPMHSAFKRSHTHGECQGKGPFIGGRGLIPFRAMHLKKVQLSCTAQNDQHHANDHQHRPSNHTRCHPFQTLKEDVGQDYRDERVHRGNR